MFGPLETVWRSITATSAGWVMKARRIDKNQRQPRSSQTGVVLLAVLTLVTLLGLYALVGQLSGAQVLAARAQGAAKALAEGREALIGDAIAQPLITDAGYLRLPDLGVDGFGVATEGQASANFADNLQDRSVIGKLPFKTLDTGPLRDQDEGCLWYVVSGRFKIFPKTAVFNWDSQGQIDVVDRSGALVASNLAALIVAPGRMLDGQSTTLADAAYSECGGNYDVRNYLDTFNTANALGGEINYFAGSVNNRVASSSNNQRFVMAQSDSYNDRFLFITAADVFDPLIRRSDFRDAITALLDYFKGLNDANQAALPPLPQVPVAGSNGTDNLLCAAAPDPAFCRNWKQMLFLTQLSAPTPITIDGVPSANCNRVLIFGGRRGLGQSRSTPSQVADKNNYLENPNAASFSVPVASADNFSGVSVFDFRNPAGDLVRCLL